MKKLIPISFTLILVFVLAIFGFGPQGNAASAPKYFAYVANSGGDGTVSAYSINPTTGALSEIKGSPFPAAMAPADIVIHPNTKFAYVINYESQNISVYSINESTGALSPIKGRPFVPNSSFGLVSTAPSGKFIYTANLDGDISIYAVNPTTGGLTPIKGSPFHIQENISDLVFDPTGKVALTINNERNSVVAYSINDKTGILTKNKETALKSSKNSRSINIDPTGKFAFVTGYNSENISVYLINTKTGLLTEIKGSPFQAFRTLDVIFALSGKFVYILSTDGILAFSFNPTTGGLASIKDGGFNFSDSNNPTSLTVDPNNKFLYATNSKKDLTPDSSNAIYAFSINATNGKLTKLKGNPFKSGDKPISIITVKK